MISGGAIMPEFAEVNIQVGYLRKHCSNWKTDRFGLTGRCEQFTNIPELERTQTVHEFFTDSQITDIYQRGKQEQQHRPAIGEKCRQLTPYAAAKAIISICYTHHLNLFVGIVYHSQRDIFAARQGALRQQTMRGQAYLLPHTQHRGHASPPRQRY